MTFRWGRFQVPRTHPRAGSSVAAACLAAVATYSLETGPRLVVTSTPDRAELAWRNARLEVLRAQFDPHFLFNTLNTVSSLIVNS